MKAKKNVIDKKMYGAFFETILCTEVFFQICLLKIITTLGENLFNFYSKT